MSPISDFGRQIVERVRQEGFAGQKVEVVEYKEERTHSDNANIITTLQNSEIVIKVNGKEETHKLFIKRPCFESEALKRVIIDGKFHRKEVEAYSSMFPFMAKFQSEKESVMESIASYIPRCYFSSHDEKNSYIVMEDLQCKGFKIADKNVGLSYDECCLTLQKVAKFHAIGYAIRVTNPGTNLRSMFSGMLNEMIYTKGDPIGYEKTYVSCYHTAIKMVSLFDPELARKMAKFQNRTHDTLCEAYVRSGDPLEVICLGDLWLNNIMFKYDDKERPIDIRFLDFQMVRAASLALDLTYFFYNSTTAKLRKDSYLHLLEDYLHSFRQELAKLGVAIPKYLTLEYLEKKMRQQLPSILIQKSFASVMQLSEPSSEDYNAVPEGLLFDYLKAVEMDAELHKHSKATIGFCTAIYNKRVRETLLEFYSEMAEQGAFD